MNVVKGVGVARPPQQNMTLKIVIWVAELIIQILRSQDHELANKVDDYRKALYDRNAKLLELKKEQELLDLSIDTVRQHNYVLEEQIRLAKLKLGELRENNN